MMKIGINLLLFICLSLKIAAYDELPLPAVPDSLRIPSQRASYIMDHFWDAMDWTDSALVTNDRFMEQNSATFYSLFPHTDSISGSQAVAVMFDGARVSDKAYRRIADIARLYLYDPASPMVDDETYAVVVDRLLTDKLLPEAELLRLQDVHHYLMMNRQGQKSSDLELVTLGGEHINLSELVAPFAQTLLMFYDPDCHDCAEMEKYLGQNQKFTENFNIVMVCPYDVDEQEWKRHAATMPESWTVARSVDENFEIDDVYEIRATPSVYILGSDMRVLAKNLTLNTIRAALINIR